MTMPNERRWAIKNTEIFLRDLMDPKKTPRVPSAVRKEAYRCLKHYPSEYHMGEAAIQAPGIWGEQKEERNDGKWAAGPVDATFRRYITEVEVVISE